MTRRSVILLCKISLLVWAVIGLPIAILGWGFAGGLTFPLILILGWPVVLGALWAAMKRKPLDKPE